MGNFSEKKGLVRPYWQDYVNHMFRVYFRFLTAPTTTELTLVEGENVRLVGKVLEKVGEDKRERIKRMFQERLEMGGLAKEWEIDEKDCWVLLSDVSKLVAKEKRLM